MADDIKLVAANYCVGFVDLLGQRALYENEGFLPDDEEEVLRKIRETIKPIYHLQEIAADFIEQALKKDSRFRETLLPGQQVIYDKMWELNLQHQRWSDGLVYFVSLHERSVKCPNLSIFGMFTAIGSLCLLHLAFKQPIRGAIDIAWGVELHPGELYGAAVATAYKLESKVAQYPRIVIGDRVIEYLNEIIQAPGSDILTEFNRKQARNCLDMTSRDFDGCYVLDYLGQSFRDYVTKEHHEELYKRAYEFVIEQLKHWRNVGNAKLAVRYERLLAYFDSRKINFKEDFHGCDIDTKSNLL